MIIKLLSSLDKVFLDCEPADRPDIPIEGFRNENISFQFAYCEPMRAERIDTYCEARIESDIAEFVRLRRVVSVPVGMATYNDADDDYLRKTAGLYPDMLVDVAECRLRSIPGQWNSIWVDVAGAPAGRHKLRLIMSRGGNVVAEATATVTVLDAELPPQQLIYTRWLHTDAIAQYYHTDMWSEAFWKYLERFIACAVKRGINTMLVPIHTPPLDTAIGAERMTSQLVDIYLTNGKYSFGFDRLRRFVDVCKRSGVKYYEIAHLFTQWGAKCTPKIVVNVNGVEKKLFGWHVSAVSQAYTEFLSAYLPALRQEFESEGILQATIWHISDEPGFDNIENYKAAKALIKSYIGDCYIIDALSDVRFYETGVVEHPVPSNNHVHDFIKAKAPELWTYYCCSQYKDVSNQFIAMPSHRERILGLQMYKYDIRGFLHWGYNFYNSQFSVYPIDPYGTTDADGFVPAGDPYQVYPGKDGEPIESIRAMVFEEGISDMRALKLLESLTSREHVLDIIDRSWERDITFYDYPRNDSYLPAFRAAINAEIMEHIKPL